MQRTNGSTRPISSSPALSTLVATGTGSGKTESFLYPILDHCKNVGRRGIKAIVIYPMNALATDQARRAEFLTTRGLTRGIYDGLLDEFSLDSKWIR